MKTTFGLLPALALLWIPVSQAHHSGSMFDMAHESVLEGTIKDFQWTNPHSWLLVDIADSSGTTKTWAFEAGPPSILSRINVKRSDFVPGQKVAVHAWLMKDSTPAGLLYEIVRPDGSIVKVSAFDKPADNGSTPQQ